ncbi:MAG: hypothetical protein GY820_01685 [Gammaproteobacteria bacterium]|nr:hypothetical protein [Gammaproteobacteria bacterium]
MQLFTVDLTGTALEFQSRRPISQKHKIGKLAQCFICQCGVGIKRAVRCLLIVEDSVRILLKTVYKTEKIAR